MQRISNTGIVPSCDLVNEVRLSGTCLAHNGDDDLGGLDAILEGGVEFLVYLSMKRESGFKYCSLILTRSLRLSSMKGWLERRPDVDEASTLLLCLSLPI